MEPCDSHVRHYLVQVGHLHVIVVNIYGNWDVTLVA